MPYRAVPYHLTKMCDVHASFVVVKMLQGWACYTLIHITSIYGSSCANNGKDALNTLDETWLADVIRIMPPILVAPTIKLLILSFCIETESSDETDGTESGSSGSVSGEDSDNDRDSAMRNSRAGSRKGRATK
eukprot:6994272-Pyramimonas_sp.AAC.1